MSKLQLSRTPSFPTPLRFFLTAPLFGLAASILLLAGGMDGLVSRWTPTTLAVTHLFTLGFMAMIMVGALFQIVPVALGGKLRASTAVGLLIYTGLTGGTLLLVAGFLSLQHPVLIRTGLLLLALAFISFLVVAFPGVHSSNDKEPSRNGVFLALIALFITTALGLLLGFGASGIQMVSLDRRWTDLHALWGIAGWVALLVSAVAFRVVPMFQKTPVYPDWLTRGLNISLLAALCMWTVGQAGAELVGGTYWVPILTLGKLLVGSGLLLFAMTTLHLQFKRDKREQNITVWYWQIGMVSLIAGVVATAWTWWNPVGVSGYWLSGGAVLLFIGFPLSVIIGMLYKIVPFLIWLHLTMSAQSTGASRRSVPGVKSIIATRPLVVHCILHSSAILLLTLLALKPMTWLLWAAGLILAASFVLLEWNLVSAIRQHRQTARAFDKQ